MNKLLEVIRLGKPRITWLLVFTAISGYIYAADVIDPYALSLFTFAGVLTVFGSNALNSYIDMEIDRMMSRTSLRPLPKGTIQPPHAIALGVLWLLGGTYLITYFFNIYAGIAALIGGLYYVFIYTIILKRKTIWNTVIGGFAGSMPVITGWLAAGKPLTIEPILLATIIFMWTPGHFWSLAYKVRDEYSIVGLPMLPSVKDEKYTKKMIVTFYTLTSISIAVSIPFIPGYAYTAAALASIALLTYASYIIWRRLDIETAWRSFKISSPTLALLFIGLIIERFI